MASIGLGTAALIGGLASAGGSVASGIMGSNAASSAAAQEVAQQNKALQFDEQMWQQQQANQAPYLAAGTSSLGSLMSAIQSGKFGPGSLPAVPTAPGPFTQTFTAPTLAQAQQTPGYQFTAQQGSKGILEGAAAAGGAISGGTLKAEDTFNSNLADTTYGNIFNQALQTYGAGLQGYQANLQGYGAQLAGYNTALGAQQQAYQQLYAPAALGEGAVQNLNQTGTNVANSIGNIFGSIGQSEAAGTVGSNNALTSGISGATNSLSQALLLAGLGNYAGTNSANTPFFSGPGANNSVNSIYQVLAQAGQGPG